MKTNLKKIFIAGHNGMVGSAINRFLTVNFKSSEFITVSKNELNLLDQAKTSAFLNIKKPDLVIIAAAKVGGIYANNTYPVDFLYDNLTIQNNLINGSFLAGVKKLIFLGSSCIYPKFANQPISEHSLFTGKLEETNEPYAIAKIAGIKLCESYNRQYNTDYRSLMPTNLYGLGDNYHSLNSHVIPGLIKRFHEAKENGFKVVKVWGSGKPKREFLYVDDLARAVSHIIKIDKKKYFKNIDPMCSHINIGSGGDVSIKKLSKLIAKVISYNGEIIFDKSKPDGTPKKFMDSSKINNLGWKALISLEEGLEMTYKSFLNSKF